MLTTPPALSTPPSTSRNLRSTCDGHLAETPAIPQGEDSSFFDIYKLVPLAFFSLVAATRVGYWRSLARCRPRSTATCEAQRMKLDSSCKRWAHYGGSCPRPDEPCRIESDAVGLGKKKASHAGRVDIGTPPTTSTTTPSRSEIPTTTPLTSLSGLNRS